MKRTKSIDLEKMRKSSPVTLAMAGSIMLSGCWSDQPAPETEVRIYRDKSACINENPSFEAQCIEAYEKALVGSEASAPKYTSRYNCESEFGYNRCIRSSNDNWFMPALAGFMLAKAFNTNGYNYRQSAPVYYYRDSWVGGNGYNYGSANSVTTTVPKSTFNPKPKPKVTKTISRGGFGSTVKAKSSWGGSSWSGRSSSFGG